jgi:hypothetical protein
MPFTEAEYIAAYTRLAAEGDSEGCARLKRMMADQFAGGRVRTFAGVGCAI